MPLSTPQPRKAIHKRAIDCIGYEREDGLWDIEAHLVDTKTYVHTRRSGDSLRQPGQPVHDMWIRVTFDLDMVIHDVEARTDDGPYPVCGDITVNFKRLIGLKIASGWRREVRQRALPGQPAHQHAQQARHDRHLPREYRKGSSAVHNRSHLACRRIRAEQEGHAVRVVGG